MFLTRSIAAALLLAAGSPALAGDPVPAELLAQHSHAFSFDDTTLSGPGWDVLARATAASQFVLLGEGHHDGQIPRFAGALYRMLIRSHGFRHLALEQDPVAIQEACAPGRTGDVDAVAAVARRYPTLFEFASDPDLRLLADACALGQAPDPVWGLEQALGSERYLEELVTLAPDPATKALAEGLLADARRIEPSRRDYTRFLHDDAAIATRLEALQTRFAAHPGSRADLLLSGLVQSARIFGYDRRAGAGEFVGLFNATEREALFKRHFLAHYAAAAKTTATPRVLFKFGAWHMYRGHSPNAAFTIGNFAHEFAIAQGMDAYGMFVFAGSNAWSDLADWEKPLYPAVRPTRPTLIDLRALRPYQRLFRALAPEKDRWLQRDLINGYDAIIVLPEGPEADWKLTGFPKPGS